MGIDGIGKRGGAIGGSGPADAQGGSRVGTPDGVDKPFELSRTAGASPVGPGVDATGKNEVRGAAAASGPSAHDRVRAGELPVEQYLEHKVDAAMRGLEGLGPRQLADIQAMLKDQLRSDPAFRELVERATGAVPTVPED
jgi:hypothetical protein